MKKIMLAFGTRPEAIKMCPLICEFKRRDKLQTVVCVTGQHHTMLDGVLESFGISPDHNLDIMKPSQSLFDVTLLVIEKIKRVLEDERPEIVLVHGDTSSAFATSLACFYLNIPVGHIEAGLRTNNIYNPFPEEFNRQAISLIAKYHFAPTELARNNLIKEGKPQENIFITGNTVIDALKASLDKKLFHPLIELAEKNKVIILTAHRRENLGEPMRNIFRAIRKVIREHRDIKIIYPLHPNPKIQEIAAEELGGCEGVYLCEPLDVCLFHNLLSRCYMILSDSGGIQEEASYLGKPLLVMRETTERPDGLQGGSLRLVGTSENDIYNAFRLVIENETEYKKMSIPSSIYGNGTASSQIADILLKKI